MYKKALLAMAAAAALVIAAPALATATAVPNLPTGVDQAYLADGDSNPEHATITLSGALVVVGAVTITCDNDFSITANDDGTAAVTAFTPRNCTMAGFPNCFLDITAENLDWGARLGYNTNETPNRYRLYLSITLIYNFTSPTPNCPVTGSFTSSGLLSPAIDITSGSLTATFGSGSGSTSSPLGTATLFGTLTSTSGVGADTQLIHD